MEQTWRWFGPKDPIPLAHIREAGATGIVTALHQIPGGTAWSDEAVAERKAMIEAEGLRWSVVESIPVTNGIKARTADWRKDIDAWKGSLRALGKAGVKTVCYNYIPIVDWTRTDLAYPLKSGVALRFDIVDFVAWDIFGLRRPDAAGSYEPALVKDAEARFKAMPKGRPEGIEKIVLAGLPGSDFSYYRSKFLELLGTFAGWKKADVQQSLAEFLGEVAPVADEFGIRLGIHPDDPPYDLFGLPRVVSNAADAKALIDRTPNPANGLTFCVGSYGARADNDIVAMLKAFARRVHFLHLRNVKRQGPQTFFEAEHLDGDSDMVGVIATVLAEEKRRKTEGRADAEIPMRPDHGHLLAADPVKNANPGYSYLGRLKGLAELRGVARAVEKLGHAT